MPEGDGTGFYWMGAIGAASLVVMFAWAYVIYRGGKGLRRRSTGAIAPKAIEPKAIVPAPAADRVHSPS